MSGQCAAIPELDMYSGTAGVLLATAAWCFASAPRAVVAGSSYDDCIGYVASNIVEHPSRVEADLDLKGDGCGVYSPSVSHLSLVAEYQSDSRLHVVIEDRKQARYQVPEIVFPRPSDTELPSSDKSPLTFKFKREPFSFQVVRKDSGEVLFDTSGTELVFERQYLSVKTWLDDDPNLYGLGEHTDPLKLGTKNYTRTFWNRDSGAVPPGENLYGDHPIYFDHRKSGTHGVFLINSNGMEVHIDQDRKSHRYYLEYRIIGGILDFYFLAGPRPADVSKQYAALAGLPAMVPYWSLGFHNCRYGYQDWFDVAEAVYNYSQAGIPLETMWTDIDYMDRRRIFTLDPKRFPIERMQSLVKYLHDRQQHYIVMVDPAVAEYGYDAYEKGEEMNVFMKQNASSNFRGVVWPGVAVFPDWFHPNATDYWFGMFDDFFNPDTGVDIDGVWIDMNEPTSFCAFPCNDPEKEAEDRDLPPEPPPVREPPRTIPGFPDSPSSGDNGHRERSTSNDLSPKRSSSVAAFRDDSPHYDIDHKGDNVLHPPYMIDNRAGTISDLTIQTDVKHHNGLWQYDAHNLYGTMMSLMTREAMLHRRPNRRTLVVTRSTFAGAGRYVAKWLGDNVSSWEQYRFSIAGMLGMASFYQVPMVGSDVCGFLEATTEKLCARWATLGAFSPFYRNHNVEGQPPQEFYQWELVTKAAKYAISVRYRMLDYIYTALYRQSQDGTPAVTPMWFHYPQDENTFGLDMQYFYGDCLMVAPVTAENGTDVDVYFPEDVFYDFETGEKIRGRGANMTVADVPFDRIPLYVRGGCVMPLRTESANTTTELRKKGFELLVAPGLDGEAKGSLYLDDGDSLDGGPLKLNLSFDFKNGRMSTASGSGSSQAIDNKEAGYKLDKVTILGEEQNERRSSLGINITTEGEGMTEDL